MTLYFIIGGLALCIVCILLIVWYANSAGKTKAENKAFKAQEKGRQKINDIVKNNVANLTDNSFIDWVQSKRNKKR